MSAEDHAVGRIGPYAPTLVSVEQSPRRPVPASLDELTDTRQDGRQSPHRPAARAASVTRCAATAASGENVTLVTRSFFVIPAKAGI